MVTNFYSASLMTAAESWRAIRSIRAEPKGELADVIEKQNERIIEFHVALEQSQQQFAAAKRIGYESRPLNLFYGLSQAGRAIAAGSKAFVGRENQFWRAKGHGLKFDTSVPNGVFATPIELQQTKKDLFSRVSLAIGSPLDFERIDFGAAINQILDYSMTFSEPEGYPRPITEVYVFNRSATPYPLEVEMPFPRLERTKNLKLLEKTEIEKALATYPAVRDLNVAVNLDGTVRWDETGSRCFVIIESPDQLSKTDPARGGVYTLKGTVNYRKSNVILPEAGQSNSSIAPLMAWWVTLYSLSMLARYAPSKWSETMSLSQSRIASRIEFLLDTAIDAVPELILGELQGLQSIS